MKEDLSELLDHLKLVSKDLQWVSESEAPFEVFSWKNETLEESEARSLLKHTNHAEDTPVEIQGIDAFFEVATRIQDWQNQEEIAIVHQYQQLVTTLKQHLSDLKVYRIGEINLDIYIVGKTPSGSLAGLTTKSVET